MEVFLLNFILIPMSMCEKALRGAERGINPMRPGYNDELNDIVA